MKPKIAVGTRVPPQVLAELNANFEVVESSSGDLGSLLPVAPQLDGLMCVNPDAALLAKATRLQAVSINFAGYDAFDVGMLTSHGVLLMNSPNALTETTADLAFTLLLATARRTVELAELMKAGQWTQWLGNEYYGADVYGQTLGIVGLGRIGSAIARRGALGFGMKVLYTSRTPKPQVETELGAERRELDELLAQSDFVALVVPLSPETTALIGERELALMKPSGILVNIARGKVVDEKALIRALQSKTILGAGLDVFEQEPLPVDSPLLKLPNVVVCPHMGSATTRTRDAMMMEAAQNLIQLLIHGKSQNVVNPAALGLRKMTTAAPK